MTRTRVFFALAAVTCATLASAASANAWFESTSASNSGTIEGFPAAMIFEYEAGNERRVLCQNTVMLQSGAWEVQEAAETYSKSKITQPSKKTGPHERLLIKKFGKPCSSEIGGIKVTEPEVEAGENCEIQVKQPTKSKTEGASADVMNVCTFSIIGCVITVQAENPGNKGLTSVTLENAPPKQVKIKANLTGIKAYAPGPTCAMLFASKSTTATFKSNSEALVPEGQKLV